MIIPAATPPRVGFPFRRRGLRGLGQSCVRQYYTMPDATTQAMLAAMGCTIEIVPYPANYTPQSPASSGGSGGGSYTPVPVPPMPAPISCSPVSPDLEQCSIFDAACAERNNIHSAQNQADCLNANAAYNRAVCEHDWAVNENQRRSLGLPSEPDTCGAQYPGGYTATGPIPAPYNPISSPYSAPASTAAPAPASTPATSQPTGGGAGPSGDGTPPSAPTFDIGGFLSGRAFLDIPNWVWLAGGLGAFLMFGGKR